MYVFENHLELFVNEKKNEDNTNKMENKNEVQKSRNGGCEGYIK